jgi:uncharacterized protein
MYHLINKITSFFQSLSLGTYAFLLLLIYFGVFLLSSKELLLYTESLVAKLFNEDSLSYIGVGFGAQLVDGALGMAYGACSTSFLLSLGVSPAAASASVHLAEVFTTAASGASHYKLGNVHRPLFKALVIPGVLGAATGAFLLSKLDGDAFKPFVNGYLLIIGFMLVRKGIAAKIHRKKIKRIGALAFVGGTLDSMGGGGWGPVVNSTLLSKGKHPKYIIGTVNTVEFFIAFASAGVFTLFLGMQHIEIITGLIIGGVVAAPIGAFLVGKIKPRPLIFCVGLLVCFLSLRGLYNYFS